MALSLVAALWLYFGTLHAVPLLDPDEGRYSEIPREMLASRDFLTPRLDGVLYFEKPPLYYWLSSLAIAVFGRNEFASRFWSAVFGLLGTGLAWLIGRSVGGARAGFYAAVILGTSPLYLALAHLNTIDMSMTFFLDSALSCFWLAQRKGGGRGAAVLWYGVFVTVALAILTKGLIGLLIPATVMGLYLSFTRRWHVLPLAVLAALALLGAESQACGARRLALGGLLPAVTALATLGLALSWITPDDASRNSWPELGRLDFAGVAHLAHPFVAPLYSLLVLCAAVSGWVVLHRRRRYGVACLAAASALLVVCGLWLAPGYSSFPTTRRLALFLKPHLAPSDRVVSFGGYPQSLPVYLDRQIDVAGYEGELQFGITRLAPDERTERFPSAGELARRWRSPERVFLVAKSRALARLPELGIDPTRILFRESDWLLFSNQPLIEATSSAGPRGACPCNGPRPEDTASGGNGTHHFRS